MRAGIYIADGFTCWHNYPIKPTGATAWSGLRSRGGRRAKGGTSDFCLFFHVI
ncbi:hypothetical protein BCR43DRAFT_494794 [Syncephalastrum racemosum]|uniref:Uncharacterized protein n=1 Tax=Syncephalastrum racemosum TaxID=13706 RepID=A0A1X2HA13_SYNRA|nr:hypothetical protein BCR43DRAFT_494794 [Syncephalastrum racemosum]